MTTAGNILYTVANGVCLIRMDGRVTYSLGCSFSAFIDKLFEDGTVSDVMVDLSQTVYLDSTTLGLLGKLANQARRHLQRKITLVSPGTDVKMVLISMGFDEVFTIIQDGARTEESLQDIPAQERDERERARIILDAHRLLMNMNDANAASFRNVVDMLESELATTPATDDKPAG
jgi:anti-anti-sigma factor